MTEQQLKDFINKLGGEVFAEQEMNAFQNKIDYLNKGNHGLEQFLNKLNDNSHFKKQIQEASYTTQSFLNQLLKPNQGLTSGTETNEMATNWVEKNGMVFDEKGVSVDVRKEMKPGQQNLIIKSEWQGQKLVNTDPSKLSELENQIKQNQMKFSDKVQKLFQHMIEHLRWLVRTQQIKNQKDLITDQPSVFFNKVFQPQTFQKYSCLIAVPKPQDFKNLKIVSNFQLIVEKHLLENSLVFIQSKKLRQIKLLDQMKLFRFKFHLFQQFPLDSCANIGRKYVQIGFNQFRNDYLRYLVSLQPEFNHSLKVLGGENEFKTDEIQINEVKPKTLDQIFSNQIDQLNFYKNIKNPNCDQPAQLAFYNQVKSMVNPKLVNFEQNTFYLSSTILHFDQASALATFLQISKHQREKKIRQIVIDSCQMSDDVLAQILKGVLLQVEETDSKKSFLNQFTYINNKFGKQSLAYLTDLLPNIYDLKFSNITDGKKGLSEQLINSLLDIISSNSKFLMKMTLSNFSLGGIGLVDQIQKICSANKFLQFLDLSNTQLSPSELCNLAKVLQKLTSQLRELNISYNKLCFRIEKLIEYKFSQEFIKNIGLLLKNCKILNHVNFSGMDFDKTHLLLLCEYLTQCQLLQSVHLNDNEINNDQQLYFDVLKLFKMSDDDIPMKRKFTQYLRTQEQQNTNSPQKFNKISLVNSSIKQLDQPQLLLSVSGEDSFQNDDKAGEKGSKQMQTEQTINEQLHQSQPEQNQKFKIVLNKKHFGQYLEQQLQLYINFKNQSLSKPQTTIQNQVISEKEQMKNLLMDKELQNLQYLKKLNNSKVGNGLGLSQDSETDQFILTRVKNHPELIFNQRPQIDYRTENRFFNKDSTEEWTLSLNKECFMCQRHQYVCIFYERSSVAHNKELIEIRDEQMLAHLKYEFNKEYLLYRTDTPIIRGTVVNRLQSQGNFERPLKMMSTALYTLLSICQSKEYAEREDNVKNIKEGVLNCLITDDKKYLEDIGIKEKLHGWKHILNDLIHHCELVDVKSINKPDLKLKDIEQKDWYTFGGFVKPGYHQVLIYDPKLEKAFCSHFITTLNSRDFFYPEYPNPFGLQLQKMVPNMWSKWAEDEPHKLHQIFQICIETDDFAIEKYVKNSDDIRECLSILETYMLDLMIYQKLMLSLSSRFPRLGFESAVAIIEQIQQPKSFQRQYKILQNAQIELCFIRANRNSDELKLKAAMRRQELLDFIMRMAQAFIYQNVGAKQKIYENLRLFFKTYVQPLTQNSKIIIERAIIRESKRLNELLFDNNKGLVELFEYAKRIQQETLPNPLFTFKQAELFFGLINQDDISFQLINQSFIYSQMTIIDENKSSKKYEYLEFVEFQEMICRIAIYNYPFEESVENQVYAIFYEFWQYFYEKGIWDPNLMPLHYIQTGILQ